MDDQQFSQKDLDGPYKATLLWNEAVRGFRDGMPAQRHWRQFRFHDDCFAASAAVSWLQRFLATNRQFSPHVTRDQTLRLMKKFSKAGIIVEVRGKKSDAEFKDNGDLYRLSTFGTPGRSALSLIGGPQPAALVTSTTPAAGSGALPSSSELCVSGGSPRLRRRVGAAMRIKRRCPSEPSRSSRAAAAQRSSTPPPSTAAPPPPAEQHQYRQTLPECRPMMRPPPTAAEVNLVWRDALLSRLETLLCQAATDIVPESCVVPAWIHHNTERVNQRGLVLPLSSGAECGFPNWVLLAMKCLANWPQFHLAHGSGGSNYPGFELDVFRVIADYLDQMPFPLVPYELYDPLLAALLHAEAEDARLRLQQRRDPAVEGSRAATGASSVMASQLPSAISLVPSAVPHKQISTASLSAPACSASTRAASGGSVENLLLLMSPQTSTPLVEPAAPGSSGVHRRRSAAADQSLFSSPVAVTPASTSVAQLRQRLLRLGVGGPPSEATSVVAESDVQPDQQPQVDSEDEYFQLERGRAASFLRAIAQSRESVAAEQLDRGDDSGAENNDEQMRFCRGEFRSASRGAGDVMAPTTLCRSAGDARVCATSTVQPRAVGNYVSSDYVTLLPAECEPPATRHARVMSSRVRDGSALSLDSNTSLSAWSASRHSRQTSVLSTVSVGGQTKFPDGCSPDSTADSAVGSSISSLRVSDTRCSAAADLTCLETVFGASVEPLTRRIPQRSVDALHQPSVGSQDSVFSPAVSVTGESDGGGACAGSADSLDGRGGVVGLLQNSIRRRQLRDDSLSRSVKRLKQRRRDQKQRREQRMRNSENQPPPSSSQMTSRCNSVASDGSLMSEKAARVLGVDVLELEQQLSKLRVPQPTTPPLPRRRPVLAPWQPQTAATRVLPPAAATSGLKLQAWQRRSVADPSRVTGGESSLSSLPISLLQAAGRLRRSVAVRDYENIGVFAMRRGRLLSDPAPLTAAHRSAAPPPTVAPPAPPPKPARSCTPAATGYQGRFRCTPSKQPVMSDGDVTAMTTDATDDDTRDGTQHSGTHDALTTADGHKLARESLQLLFALLPPSSRRQLQLLMRFLQRTAGNRQLQLLQTANGCDTRQLLLERFSSRVLCAPPDQLVAGGRHGSSSSVVDTSVVARRLVAYLLDHQAEILTPPVQLKPLVERRLQAIHRQKVVYDEVPVTYCELVSAAEFERQRLSQSSDALLSLLDTILTDFSMTRKDKRKRLKQFREAYPEIYGHRLIEADQQLQNLNQQHNRARTRLTGGSILSASLARSRSLRL